MVRYDWRDQRLIIWEELKFIITAGGELSVDSNGIDRTRVLKYTSVSGKIQENGNFLKISKLKTKIEILVIS